MVRRKREARNTRGIPGAGDGGNVPPIEHRWRPGQSGNPAGRRAAGAYLTEYINSLALSRPTEEELRRIVRDPREDHLRRVAAERLLRMRMPPLADYAGLVNGTETLQQLEARAVDTAIVKKLKERQEYNANGELVAVTRELELHNLAGEEFDRVADRTEGRPTQKIDLDASPLPPIVQIITPLTRMAEQTNGGGADGKNDGVSLLVAKQK